MRSRLNLWLLAGGVVLGAYFVLTWKTAGTGVEAFDIYMYYYPNMLYAARQVAAGGRGLLWNAYQNCGEPFFGISSTGILYPASFFFLLLGGDHALYAVTVFNLAVAGVGLYLLARELGLSRAAAVCGAAAFELGNATLDNNTWTPLVGGAYVWMPAAMLCCERILRTPSLRTGAALAIVLSIAMLPGFPQPVVYCYQLIALRSAWEFVSRRGAYRRQALSSLAVGLGLPPLLTAVQFFPGLEMARLSVRSNPLTVAEIKGGGFLTWSYFRNAFSQRRETFNPFTVLPCIIAGASLARSNTRRIALFYLVAGVLSFAIAFGPSTPLFDWYLALPLGRTFREPARFLWVTSFCLAVLTGFGVDAIVSPSRSPTRWAHALRVVAGPALVTIGLYQLSLQGLLPLEWALAGIVIGAALLTAAGAARPLRVGAVVAAVVLNLAAFRLELLPPRIASWYVRSLPLRRLLPDGDRLLVHASLFAMLRDQMTAQDRIYIANQHQQFTLMPKTAQLFGVPSMQDYEPQPTRRSADYYIMMRTGMPMQDLNSLYFGAPEGPEMVRGLRRRLLDLAAARYLVVDASIDRALSLQPPPAVRFTSENRDTVVYENTQAFPRAFYVPELRVVADPAVLLRRLATGNDDLRQVALVERDPSSGFTGIPGNGGRGTVEFLTDDPEHVVLRVRAPERGFVHLADQYYPGWQASVNGVPTPIQQANFLFRVVEVPAGESVVEFRFEPLSLRIGAGVSVASIVGLAAALVLSARRNR
jgi:hypothetical protein